MVPELREKYNAAFSAAAYQQLLEDLNRHVEKRIEFRIAETPVFLGEDFLKKLIAAGDDLVGTIRSKDFKQLTEKAIPAEWKVANENDHPHFLTFDFAVCRDEAGELTPRLIELQGFPSLYGYQAELAKTFQKRFPVTGHLTPFFLHENEEDYFRLLHKTIVGQHRPEEVVLLDIHAPEQKTAVDFYITSRRLGIPVVSLSDLKQVGDAFFYSRNGKDYPLKKIYNRLIFDEVKNKEEAFRNVPGLLTSDQVEWVTHPNWFYRISKYTMPFLKSEFVPQTWFLKDVKAAPEDLQNYVLKPLFSFAGQGVKIDVTEADLREIQDPENWILQEKVAYEPVVQSPDGLVKCELRLMYLWPGGEPDPQLVISLARLSRGKMIGVDFNRNVDWVGGTVGLFRKP